MSSVKWKGGRSQPCLLQGKTPALKLSASLPSQYADDTGPGKFQMMAERPGFPRKENKRVKGDLIEAFNTGDRSLLSPVLMFEHRDMEKNGKSRKLKSEEKKYLLTAKFKVSLEKAWTLTRVDSNPSPLYASHVLTLTRIV